jgi:hypothetical protein
MKSVFAAPNDVWRVELDVLEPRADESTTQFDVSQPNDDLPSTKTDESGALKRRSRCKK